MLPLAFASAQGFSHSVNANRDAWNGFTVWMTIFIPFNSLITRRLYRIFGGESGILAGLFYSFRPFNKMPATVMLTASYVLSHLEHSPHKHH
jgi:hypothetical protein